MNVTDAAEAYGYTMFGKLVQVGALLEVPLLGHKCLCLFFKITLIYVIDSTWSKRLFLCVDEHVIMHKQLKNNQYLIYTVPSESIATAGQILLLLLYNEHVRV